MGQSLSVENNALTRETADESVGLGRLQCDSERTTYGAQTHEKRSR
jgi:hypothetical protein